MIQSKPVQHVMNALERRAVQSLAGIFAFRMLGLFMILPVFSLYADELYGATPLLIGVALGAYGLTQALLQIPYGLLSDRFGRKPIITMGLLVFALGSIVAAQADSIYMVIFGRALQGAGAIAAAMMALVADLTREENRIRAMATIGVSIGASFSIALVIGPILNSWIGISGIFWFTAILALGAIGLLYWVVPNPVHSHIHRDAEAIPAQFRTVLKDGQLLRLNAGILCLHFILMASFVVLPVILRDVVGLEVDQHWKLYLPALLVSVAGMIPLILQAEKHHRMKQVFMGSILLIVVAEFALWFEHSHLWAVLLALIVFYTAFNTLEAILPSLISKMAPLSNKGTAMGFYSTSQFFGAFLGGASAGWLQGLYGLQSVFLLCAVVALIWAFIAASMQQPRYLNSYLLALSCLDKEQAKQLASQLTQVTGVMEAVVIAEDEVAYLRVDQEILDEEALLNLQQEYA